MVVRQTRKPGRKYPQCPLAVFFIEGVELHPLLERKEKKTGNGKPPSPIFYLTCRGVYKRKPYIRGRPLLQGPLFKFAFEVNF